MEYQYSALPPSCMRLLLLLPGRFDDPLCGEIFEAEFPSCPDTCLYEALSYAWGAQTNWQPLYVVQPDGSSSGTINLTPNLHSALRHLRLEHSTRTIWCDLISINQSNIKERQHEIIRMADIYRNARQVTIWLGPEADQSSLAVKAIASTGSQIQLLPELRSWEPMQNADPRFSRASQEIPHSQQELEAIQRLFARSWFKRLWVRQEVTLARLAVVMVGHDQVSWTHLISAASFLDTFIRLRGKSRTAFGRDLMNLVELGCLKAYKDILEIFHACRECECTEDYDRVYGLLGLLSPERTLAIRPDYSKGPKNVYQDLVMQYHRHHQRLNILTLCEAAEAPSWVPDLHKLRLNTGVNTRVAQYCWASGEAASSVVFNEKTIETYGVKCGVLGRNAAPPIDKNSENRVMKHAIVRILREHMGEDVSLWDNNRLETLAKGLLGCIWFERTGRKNHSPLGFALLELKKWVSGDRSILDLPEGHESLVLMNHIVRVLFHGDSCQWTQDGHLGLGYSGCQEGDDIFAILGCRRLMALRKEPATERYRIVGKFDHPAYNDGEALLGELSAGWEVNYRHLLLASGRPRFEHMDGTSQWQDPRLQGVPLPNGWYEGQDQDGYPYWSRVGIERSYSDPRLTHGELRKRGVKVERLAII